MYKKQKLEHFEIANKKMAFQSAKEVKRAAELLAANQELAFQNPDKERFTKEINVALRDLTKVNKRLNDVNCLYSFTQVSHLINFNQHADV
jgi:Tfp pilus assembly PilM family ATPase